MTVELVTGVGYNGSVDGYPGLLPAPLPLPDPCADVFCLRLSLSDGESCKSAATFMVMIVKRFVTCVIYIGFKVYFTRG
jgi:hypothetical protein